MQLYRFSPIQNEEDCLKALDYTHLKLKELSGLVVDGGLSVKTLKIFAHYEDEYTYLKNWVNSIGTGISEDSPTSYYVRPHKLKSSNNGFIEFIGIRVPDPYRSQVGCGDYVVADFDEFQAKYLGKSPYIREVPHQRYQMLELFHPDYDVLGYVTK